VAVRNLFIDMNAYFAAVEQQDKPALRGRPVVVIPTDAETTSCIAAKSFRRASSTASWPPAKTRCSTQRCSSLGNLLPACDVELVGSRRNDS
jgi:nucleotidyltransferase/DNA polymerase involved in DNA repair